MMTQLRKKLFSFVMVLAFLGLIWSMVPSQAVALEAAESGPLGCTQLGCPGGPDHCMDITVKWGGVSISVSCYMRAA